MNNDYLTTSARMGISYLLRCIREDGTFVYEINAKTGATSNSYNILRHAGSLYVLYQWCAYYYDRDMLSLLEPAAGYLKRQTCTLKSQANIQCVVEGGTAKLGGTALTLLALTEKYKITPSADDLVTMKNLAGFIIWMQDAKGKFRSKLFFPSEDFSYFESTYYPGEAILALIHFYEIEPDPIWLKHAKLGIDYLTAHPVRNKNGTHGHNHWFATALSAYPNIFEDDHIYAELFLITNATIERMHENKITGNGEFSYSSAEMATRGETILAALSVTSKLKSIEETKRLKNELTDLIIYCLRFQIKKDISWNGLNIIGGIRRGKRKNKIRIDFVQHVVQVLLGLSTLA